MRRRPSLATVAWGPIIGLPLTALLLTVTAAATFAVERRPLEATVKIVPAASMPEAGNGPTTPGGKLPQYQLGHEQRRLRTQDERRDPRWRFLLGLPQGPLLVEATITIDGQPFRMAREQRIEQLLQPPVTATIVDPPTPEPQGPATAEEETLSSAEAPSPADAAPGAPDQPEPADEATATGLAVPQVPKYLPTTSAAELIRRYGEATGQPATHEEARWLLTNRIDGPVTLLLQDNFQRFRAGQRPALSVLDRDRNGGVSAEELQQATASIEECDLNRDGIVQFTEIAEAAADPRRASGLAGPGRLITAIPDADTAAEIWQRLSTRYAGAPGGAASALSRLDQNGNGQFDADELDRMANGTADVGLTVTFQTLQPEDSRIALTHVRPEFAEAAAAAATESGTIAVVSGGSPVWFQAVQGGPSDQVALGAVDDGYPLLPVLDPNDDGRLTIRERRELPRRLAAFDANGDGSLTEEETQAPIRVCIGLGPVVHGELASLRSMNRIASPPPTPGPEWFVRMDRNKDHDLTRGEFSGSDEQFASLDRDGDHLVSADEAAEDRSARPATPMRASPPPASGGGAAEPGLPSPGESDSPEASSRETTP